ncbi:MAG: hypothetical protein A4E20_04685 [Nitrospira sp. SG-bin2]|nr:MAG: hypothetical protein A4E20_04685 [Nitrospira sp. SG-bin2]
MDANELSVVRGLINEAGRWHRESIAAHERGDDVGFNHAQEMFLRFGERINEMLGMTPPNWDEVVRLSEELSSATPKSL